MHSPHQTAEFTEVQRLAALLPIQLQSHVVVVAARPSSDLPSGLPIDTQPLEPSNFSMQINPSQWRRFTPSQRDLLFWHEVAQIQTRAAGASWERAVLLLGLAAALVELPSHAVLAVAAALTVAGLAAYRLYQARSGEQHLRKLTAADQTAIELAMQSGYSFATAHSSLYEALNVLAKQPALKAHRRSYQTRLQVLDILKARSNASTREALADPIGWSSAWR
jgi:Protein of unknown function (DUF3318)